MPSVRIEPMMSRTTVNTKRVADTLRVRSREVHLAAIFDAGRSVEQHQQAVDELPY